MRWLVLLLVLVAGRASAAPCGQDIKPFPADDATDVALNTHLWVPASVAGPYVLTTGANATVLAAKPYLDSPMLEIDPGTLLPDHFYTLTAGGKVVTSFATGRETVVGEAMQAVVDHVRVTDGILDLKVHGLPAVMLHVWIQRDKINGESLGDLWIPSEGIAGASLSRCTGVEPRLGSTLCFWIRSVSAIGLDGGGGSRCTVDKQAEKAVPALVSVAALSESPSRLIVLACAVVLALLFVGLRAGRERLYAKVCEPQPMDRVTVGWIARRQLIRRLIALAVIAAAAYAVLPIAALGVIVAADVWRLARVARSVATGWPMIADPPRRRAYVTDGIYFQGWITVRPRDLERVTAAHMPTARLL